MLLIIIIDYESSNKIINENTTYLDNLINPNIFNFNMANWSKFYNWLDHSFELSYRFTFSGQLTMSLSNYYLKL